MYTEATIVSVNGATAKSRLQPNSERRALIDKVVDLGGSTTVGELESHFGYDLRGKIASLSRAGWLFIEEPE